MPSTISGVERSRSVSSMRRIKRAAEMPRVEPIEQSGARSADVQVASG